MFECSNTSSEEIVGPMIHGSHARYKSHALKDRRPFTRWLFKVEEDVTECQTELVRKLCLFSVMLLVYIILLCQIR